MTADSRGHSPEKVQSLKSGQETRGDAGPTPPEILALIVSRGSSAANNARRRRLQAPGRGDDGFRIKARRKQPLLYRGRYRKQGFGQDACACHGEAAGGIADRDGGMDAAIGIGDRHRDASRSRAGSLNLGSGNDAAPDGVPDHVAPRRGLRRIGHVMAEDRSEGIAVGDVEEA